MVNDDGEPAVGVIRPIKIEDEMRASYLDYAMSVIVSRALPDVRDGLKPVQRRILFSMHELSLRPNAAYKKSARIVGEVLGKYHPHGDSPIYEAMARMAQPFSMRYPLVDGQGNFGSVDGDPPAAMRYTEARLSQIAEELLVDIDKQTVDFEPNFDSSLEQPSVLPARLPNLLVNGSSGIAVGMATSIPPHNLAEVCEAIAKLIDEPETTGAELAEIVRGPDFPTGGIMFGRDRIRQMYATGQGRVIVRGRAHVEEGSRSGRLQIVVSELPYQVNKSNLVEKIADMVKDRRVEGISDLRDESDRQGMRIVIELKRDGQPKQILNTLYKHTALQSSFPVHMLALVDGYPRTMGLERFLRQFIDHRRIVIRRRTEFDLGKAREREHILQGYLIALGKLDLVIRTIRNSASAEAAREALQAKPFNMSERQAQAVLDLQLRRLAALERQKIEDEYAEIIKQINFLEDLLANPRKIDFLIKEDSLELKRKFGDRRRTQIVDADVDSFSEEDLVPHGEAVVALTFRNYIKRMPLETYRKQRRGGRGVIGMGKREEDPVRQMVIADTHDQLLFFTDRGRVYQLPAYEIDETERTAKGRPLVNYISADQTERVTAIIPVRDYASDFLVVASQKGEVKKTRLSEFEQIRASGKIAMNLEPDDVLVSARIASDDDDVLLVTAGGQAVRFRVGDLRSASRESGGVRGISVTHGDHLVGMEVPRADHELLTVTQRGFGKRTKFDEFPRHSRGGKGVIAHQVNARTGLIAAMAAVTEEYDVIAITRSGVVIRTAAGEIRLIGRSTMGVHTMDVGPNDAVASFATVDVSETPAAAARAEANAGARAALPEGEAPPKVGGRPRRGGGNE